MADIDVQRKSPSIWPWILGLVVLALLIWLLATQWGGEEQVATVDDRPVAEEPAPPVTTPAEPTAAAPAALQEFSQWVDRRDAEQAAGTHHEYTVNGLRQLADAIESVAQQGQAGPDAVREHTDRIRDNARQIEQSPEESTQHSAWAHEGAQAAVSAMESLSQQQPQTGAGQSIDQARQAADAIGPGGLLLEQTDQVGDFFERARDALQSLTGRSVQG